MPDETYYLYCYVITPNQKKWRYEDFIKAIDKIDDVMVKRQALIRAELRIGTTTSLATAKKYHLMQERNEAKILKDKLEALKKHYTDIVFNKLKQSKESIDIEYHDGKPVKVKIDDAEELKKELHQDCQPSNMFDDEKRALYANLPKAKAKMDRSINARSLSESKLDYLLKLAKEK